jgi:hypothetical protein
LPTPSETFPITLPTFSALPPRERKIGATPNERMFKSTLKNLRALRLRAALLRRAMLVLIFFVLSVFPIATVKFFVIIWFYAYAFALAFVIPM